MYASTANIFAVLDPPGGVPLGYFLHAAGPASRPTLMLDWVYAAISVSVCVIIAVLLAGSMFRRRPPGTQVAAGDRGGVKWVAIGSGISIAVLFGMAIYALVVLRDVSAAPRPPQLTITVTAYDWWWRVDYPTDRFGGAFTTANEIHIPTGQPVLIHLHSADVIHAFWVPQLAGKTQMIPGLANQQWLQADMPGVYRGQCAQFCGLQHAHMGFEVIAERPADFLRWRQAQAQAAPLPSGAQALAGQALFVERCGNCHSVRGTQASGQHAPDLTHLMSRRMIAAGMFAAKPDTIAAWVQSAQELKPGVRMPDFPLTPREKTMLMAYLTELH